MTATREMCQDVHRMVSGRCENCGWSDVEPLALREIDSLASEMIAQARLGHKQFCLGAHEHEGGELEYEWADWSVPLYRLALTARAGLEDQARLERLSDPQVWDCIGFDDHRLQWSVYHGHSIQTSDGLAAHVTYHDDLRAAIDDIRGAARSGRDMHSNSQGGNDVD